MSEGEKNSSSRKRKLSRCLPGRRKKKKVDQKLPPLGFIQLFRYSDALDRFLMISGVLAAIVQGSALPCMLLIFARVTDGFISFASCSSNVTDCPSSQNQSEGNNTTSASSELSAFEFESAMTTFAIYYVIVACVVIICSIIQVQTWVVASSRQSRRIRYLFFRAILRQEREWVDKNQVGGLSSRMSEDVTKISDAIGDKFVIFISKLATFVAGFVVGFVTGWRLTLVILAVTPLLFCISALMAKFISSWTSKELNAYAKAGLVVQNVLGNIRTVVAYGAESIEVERYNARLEDAEKQGTRKGLLQGIFMGAMWCIIFCSYALAFWYGATLVLDPSIEFSAGKLITVFFAILVGAINLGQASSSLDIFLVGRCAAAFVFPIIERKSKIDPISQEGKIPDLLVGDIAFKDVKFQYPSRLNHEVLNGVNVVFKSGQTTVLVGPSGMGKTSMLRLIQRLYDPCSGQVTLDGEDLKNLNVRWLRQAIGIVQQDPILFGTTIYENILLGSDNATYDDVIEAAKSANAYDFIMDLPEKFETMVGAGGCQLSGGQKQRVAVARALVRKPKILLLDQACSALDTQSEAVVLDQLKEIQHKCTIIMVAHRLSTISVADVIIGMEHGQIVERGTQEELMKNNKVFFTLATMQEMASGEHLSNGDLAEGE